MQPAIIAVALATLAQQVPTPCATPRAAVAAFLENTDGRADARRGPPCVEIPEGQTARDVDGALARLRRVMNARGILVRLDEISDDADFRDEETGRHALAISSRIPQVVVEKTDQSWRLTAASIARIEVLHRETFVLDLPRLVERLPSWARTPVFGVAMWQVLVLSLLFVLGWLARLVFTHVFAGQLRRVLERTKGDWAETVLKGVSTPVGNLALAGVLALGIPSVQLGVHAALVAFLAVRVIAALSVVMLLYRAVDLIGIWLTAKAKRTDSKLDDQLVPIARRSLKVVTVVVGVIFVLQNLDVDVTSLLTGLGLGGLAFALAAKDVVSNFFGSVTIFLDKPFQIGDWVTVVDVEGAVEEVGIRSTRIRTFQNTVVTVPNGKFTDAIVNNWGLRKFRRTTTTLSVTYDTTPAQIEAFCAGIRAILRAHPTVRQADDEVHFSEFGSSGLGVYCSYFTTASSWSEDLRVRHEIYLDVLRLAEALKVRFAFPTQTVHVESIAQPSDTRSAAAPDDQSLARTIESFAPGGANVIPPGPRGFERHLPPPKPPSA